MIRLVKMAALVSTFAFSAAHGQSAAISLIRNSSITSLNPTTPPMASLFDSQTGRLLGQQIPQDLAFVFYSEPLSTQGDGPLVVYQMDEGNQTLFLSKTEDGRLTISSLAGTCREVDSASLGALLNNVPILSIERSHAQSLFGVSQYPGAMVCEDEGGVVTVKTLPEVSEADRDVGLLYLRDSFEIPRAYITVSHGAFFDVFSLDGGLRFDQTDPKSPSYSALDSNGQPAASSTALVDPTCEQIANTFHNCITQNQQWRKQSQIYADHLINLTGRLEPFNCKHALQIRGFPGCIVALAGFVTLVYPQPVADCTPQGSPAAACPPPPGSDPSCLGGVDCHLDGGNGSPYCVFATTGPNSCSSNRTCGGAPHCEAGICTTTPEPEVCNARDDDCDGRIDEGNSSLCNDHDACTQDSCGTSGCIHTAVLCDDGNVCTTDSCDVVAGCVNQQEAGCSVVYSQDFQGALSSEWSTTSTAVTPIGGRRFLGEFGNDTVTLTLHDLPPHSALRLTGQVFILKTWDGNGTYPGCCGPDVFVVTVQGGSELLRTTFGNQGLQVVPGKRQAYPGTYPGSEYPLETGASEVKTLGYTCSGVQCDSVYTLDFLFSHSGDSVSLTFSANGLAGVSDESWGLDNIVVAIDAAPIPPTARDDGTR